MGSESLPCGLGSCLPLWLLIGGDHSISSISLRAEGGETPAATAFGILNSLLARPRTCTASGVGARPLFGSSPTKRRSRQPSKPRLVRTGPGRQGPEPQGRAAPSSSPKRSGRRAPAAKTPRILYRGKSGSSSKMGRQGLGGNGAAGRSMQRSQSRSSLSASFEALAGYFPCMNSLEEEDGGEAVRSWHFCSHMASRRVGGWRVSSGEREYRVAASLSLPFSGTVLGRDSPESAPAAPGRSARRFCGELHGRCLGERLLEPSSVTRRWEAE